MQTVAEEKTIAQQPNPKGKRKGKGCLIVILVVVLFVALMISCGKSAEEDQINTKIVSGVGVSMEESDAIRVVLQECGVMSVDGVTHDASLDNKHNEGETGYRIATQNAQNIFLYLNADHTVNMVQWNDEDMYKDGAVVMTVKDVVNRPDLEVISAGDESDGYFRYVVGEIRNNSAKSYSYVQVEIGLYQGDNLVGSTLDNVNNLEPGQTWHFKALVTDNTSDNYKITNITGF